MFVLTIFPVFLWIISYVFLQVARSGRKGTELKAEGVVTSRSNEGGLAKATVKPCVNLPRAGRWKRLEKNMERYQNHPIRILQKRSWTVEPSDFLGFMFSFQGCIPIVNLAERPEKFTLLMLEMKIFQSTVWMLQSQSFGGGEASIYPRWSKTQ